MKQQLNYQYRPSQKLQALGEAELKGKPIVAKVFDVIVTAHCGKTSSTPTLRVQWILGGDFTVIPHVSEFLPLNHEGKAKQIGRVKWRSITGRSSPDSVAEGLKRKAEVLVVKAVEIKQEGQYWKVVKHRRAPGK
jgi:hypothetical protein